MTLEKKKIDNIERKGVNAGNRHFLHFKQYFLHHQKLKSSFFVTSYLSSAVADNLDQNFVTLYRIREILTRIYLPSEKILDQSKIKRLAGDKINVTKEMKLCWECMIKILPNCLGFSFSIFLNDSFIHGQKDCPNHTGHRSQI